jgi:isopenicillin-N epimerase
VIPSTPPSSGILTRREALKLALLGTAGLGWMGCADQAGPTSAAFIGMDLAGDAAEWMSLRERFLIAPGVIYLNNSSIGLPPAAVIEAVAAGYRQQAQDPIAAKHTLQDHIRNHTLPGLGRFFGVAPQELTLTQNASISLHLQAAGLRLDPGDEVVITTQEHPAGRQPWEYLSTRHGIVVREVFIPSPLPSDEEIMERFETAVGPKTKAIAFCHVTRGGHLYPVARLCSWARERGLVSLVDGAQAVGQFRIDLTALGCDAYSASLHKWMLGPSGTGFLFIRGGSRPRFDSSFEVQSETPSYGIPGTVDFPIRAALAAAVTFMEQVEVHAVERRCRYLSDHVKSRLDGERGVTLLSGKREQSAPGSTIFEIEGVDAVEAVDRLAALDIHIDEHQRDGHNAIRISTHIYNTTEDIGRAVEALLALRPAQ